MVSQRPVQTIGGDADGKRPARRLRRLTVLLALALVATLLSVVATNSVASASTATDNELRRMYRTAFNRAPDAAGFANWQRVVANNCRSGLKTGHIAFSSGPEFLATVGGTTNRVRAMYRIILNREADSGGLNNWVGQINSGKSVAWVADGIASSSEANARRNTICGTSPVPTPPPPPRPESLSCRDIDHDCERAVRDNRWHYAVFRVSDTLPSYWECPVTRTDIGVTIRYRATSSEVEIGYIRVVNRTSGVNLTMSRLYVESLRNQGGAVRFQTRTSLSKWQGDYLVNQRNSARVAGTTGWGVNNEFLAEIQLGFEGESFLCGGVFYAHLER